MTIFLIYALLLIFIFLFCEYVIGHTIKKLYVLSLHKKCKGKIVLTFDDGPGERLEPIILALLKEYGVKATFFLNAERAIENCNTQKNLIESDNEIAAHCHKHLSPFKAWPWLLTKDIGEAYNLLEGWLTNKTLFRPPYGKLTLSMWIYCRLRGIKLAFWTHDSGDTYKNTPKKETLIRNIKKNGGGVVLMHSFDRLHDDAAALEQYVSELTNDLLHMAKEEKLEVCVFNDL